MKVEKSLPNCQHTATFFCSEPTTEFRCRKQCEKIVCTEGHMCKKRCFEPCGLCNTQVVRQLPCGHPLKTECHRDLLKILCKTPKEVILPSCTHKAQIACSEDPEKAVCPFPCDKRLDCGHQCTLKCHVNKDPNHAEYQCMKRCERKRKNCNSDHKCPKKCFEECDLCLMKVKRVLPCKHEVITECHLDDKDIKCGYDLYLGNCVIVLLNFSIAGKLFRK